MYNYTPQPAHHAKFDFDPTTWVVWANSQFATVWVFFFFPSFLYINLYSPFNMVETTTKKKTKTFTANYYTL